MSISMVFTDVELEALDDVLSYVYMVDAVDRDNLGFTKESRAAFRAILERVDVIKGRR